MTALLEGARALMGRSTELDARVAALEVAVRAARGRLDDALVDDAESLVGRASARLRLSADHTVVALAGATGSGKSSTFNALAGLELATVGVRRPTTAWATACVWGRDPADDLLEWLGIPPRHRSSRQSMLDRGESDAALDGVVLIDLPDHDSTEVAHHLEVDRLVQLADLLVWILDPQKYADAAIHRRYLTPLAGHQDVMVVVVNHIDTVPEHGRAALLQDVRRLLAADGMPRVPVIACSAKDGTGLGDLRAEITRRVSAKQMSRIRLGADLRAIGDRLVAASGSAPTRDLPQVRVAELDDALAEAAGVPTVVQAVERASRERALRATGWPVTAWLSRLRPDPLRRLHLDLGRDGRLLTSRARTSVPAPTPVQRARVDTEVRAVADEVSQGLPRPWADAVRRASVSRLEDVADRLDQALAGTDLGAARVPVWAEAVRFLQWVLLSVVLGGALWLGGLALTAYLHLPEPTTPSVGRMPLPTLMLLGGIGLGVLLAGAARLLVRLTARRRARIADRRLRSAVREVSQDLVVAPVEAELEAFGTLRSALATLLR